MSLINPSNSLGAMNVKLTSKVFNPRNSIAAKVVEKADSFVKKIR